jgi:hypothetical protein
MDPREHPQHESGKASWAGLLFGEEPWLMLLALLACGLLTFILVQQTVAAILAVVLVSLVANAWCWRHLDLAAEKENRT